MHFCWNCDEIQQIIYRHESVHILHKIYESYRLMICVKYKKNRNWWWYDFLISASNEKEANSQFRQSQSYIVYKKFEAGCLKVRKRRFKFYLFVPFCKNWTKILISNLITFFMYYFSLTMWTEKAWMVWNFIFVLNKSFNTFINYK